MLAETPVAETEGVTGLPEMMNAEQSLINQGVGDVISQSFGATENTFPGFGQGNFSSLLNLRLRVQGRAAPPRDRARRRRATPGRPTSRTTGHPVPDAGQLLAVSDPLVTSIGGAQLFLDNAGNRLYAQPFRGRQPARPAAPESFPGARRRLAARP